jgi:glycosyltransferase involved in cell wall biosynthesis
MKQKKLVILTDNFGVNFSGGAIATARTFACLQDEFAEIFVIGKQVGVHGFRQLTLLPYKNAFEAIAHIRSFDVKNTIFYADFYMAYYFILARVPFYFTYHDNWPEQKKFGWQNYLCSFFYIPIYHWIIKKANWVVTVSNYKYQFTSSLTSRTSIIRNGINCEITKYNSYSVESEEVIRCIMLGNIDDRKYGWALDLFQCIDRDNGFKNISIDIFGRLLDVKLAQKLEQFSFVQLKDFTMNVDFRPYHFFLNTSKIENLSISVCEALLNHTPVFCFNVGGLREVVEHGYTGMLAQKGHIKELFTYLQDACLGRITFDFSRQNLAAYDWHYTAQEYKKILGSCRHSANLATES